VTELVAILNRERLCPSRYPPSILSAGEQLWVRVSPFVGDDSLERTVVLSVCHAIF
jgi:hypothetical protein